MTNQAQLGQLLSKPSTIAILSHVNPDGDAIGSSLGLYHCLKQLGHKIHLVMPSAMPDFIEWLPDSDKIINYQNHPTECVAAIMEAKIVFCLDFNALDRLENLADSIRNKVAPKVLIDHHLYPEDFADFVLHDTSASSTCELIWRFIQQFKYQQFVNQSVIDCLYTGIMTDTGGFSYAISPRLLRIVAELIEQGADHNELSDKIFSTYTEKRLRLLGFCLSQRMEVLPELQTAIISLSKEDHQAFQIERGDTEGIVNYMLKMQNVKCACLLAERPGEVKLSLRSKGDYSVQALCSKHFNGGGHKNASGGAMKAPIGKVVETLKAALPEIMLPS